MRSASALAEKLPAESFVAFTCRKLALPEPAFLNPYAKPDVNLLSDYAFAIVNEGEEAFFTPEEKTFLGERYGGEGLGSHGGGVRCGVERAYQIKGIGKNPLAGEGVDFWHSHGNASLAEGLYEAIWGEILQRILPHGAVRVPGIIATGTECWVKAQDNETKTKAPRALIVREAAVRPAHFERAYRYRPTPHAKQHFVHDTARTASAINRLPELLPRSRSHDADSWAALTPVEKLHYGLHEMCLRFAEQTAVARAKRLMHGAMSTSNLCLDGRWIDYGTTSALSEYTNVVTGLQTRSFWEEHLQIYYIISNLCFYLHKYFRIEEKNLLPNEGAFKKIFFHHFEFNLMQQFILLTGYPEEVLKDVWQEPQTRDLAQLLLKIARSGHHQVFVGIPDDHTRIGDYDLGAILFALARYHGKPELPERLTGLIAAESVRKALTDHYGAFVKLVHARAFAGGKHDETILRRRVILRAAKAAKNIDLLYRHKLSGRIGQLMTRHSAIPELRTMYERTFVEVIDQVEVLHQKDTDGRILFWKRKDLSIHLDSSFERWTVTETGKEPCSLPFSSAFDVDNLPPALVKARQWWGDELWEALK